MYRWIGVILILFVGCGTPLDPPIGIRCVFNYEIRQDEQRLSDSLEHIFPPDRDASESGVARQFSQVWHGYEGFVSWTPKELSVQLEHEIDDPPTRYGRGMTQSFDLTKQPKLLEQGGDITGLISFRTGDAVDSFLSYSYSAFK